MWYASIAILLFWINVRRGYRGIGDGWWALTISHIWGTPICLEGSSDMWLVKTKFMLLLSPSLTSSFFLFCLSGGCTLSSRDSLPE